MFTATTFILGILMPLSLLGASLAIPSDTRTVPIWLRACVILVQAASFSWLTTSMSYWPPAEAVQRAELQAGPWVYLTLALPLLFAIIWSFRHPSIRPRP